MATIVNARDVLLQAASPRVEEVTLPTNITVSKAQLFGLTVTYSEMYWRVGSDGNAVNDSITLTANLPTGVTGFVTWSKSGTGTVAPSAGTTNTWTIYAADQTGDTTYYTATITYNGLTYTDTVTITRIADGLQGQRGPTGVPGTITAYGTAYGISVSAWSDGLANRIIRNVLTGETLTTTLSTTDHLLLGDTVTLTNGANYAETRYWTGFIWDDVGTIIDGNLLVNGTVSATKLTAGDILTGQNANATIKIGDTTTIGAIRTPFHVFKNTALDNQVLFSARNDKDDSAAIWASSVKPDGTTSYGAGNAITGTWHASATDANNTKWSLIGALGAKFFGAAVAGSAYGSGNQGAAFRWFNYANNIAAGANSYTTAVGLASETRAITAVGTVELIGSGSSLMVGGSEGTSGQVLTSQGPGQNPVWTSSSTSYASIQSSAASASSALTVSSTIRATGLNAPASGVGVEIAYGNPGSGTAGFVLAYDRTTSAYKPLKLWASSFSFDQGSADFVQSPTVPTVTTTDNSTKAASTAYVVNRIANDAPSKTGTGASGTWAINISGSAGSVTAAAVQTGLSGVSSVTNVSGTVRSTALTAPTSGAGLEMAYDSAGNTSYVISYDRSASAYKGLNISGSSITFNVTPNVGGTNLMLATSSAVTSALGYTPYNGSTNPNGYITSSGSISGSSGSCTGNAASATTASNALLLNNKKIVGGSGTAGSTISTGLSSIEGFTAIAVDPWYAAVSSISGGNVVVKVRDAAGTDMGAQAVRWVATGT